MYKKRLMAAFMALVLIVSLPLVLGSCDGGNERGEQRLEGGMWDAINALQDRFPAATPVGTGVGGVLNMAMVVPSHFAGVLNPAFSITADDGTINDFMFSSLLNLNAANMYSQNGAAHFEFSVENGTFTMHFHDDVNMLWHDGVPVTMYDLEWAFHLIAHPDVVSPRFGPALNTSTVLGVDAYRARTADRISGIRVFNSGRSIEFSFESLAPDILFGGLWTTPLPRHRFEGIAWEDIVDHPYSRSDIIGNGPFMFQSIVPGEAVELVANPNFWLGAPRLDGINIEVIEPALIGSAMQIGRFDITTTFPATSLEDYEHRLTNSTFVSALQRRFDFMGFRFGTMHLNDDGTHRFDPNPDSIINCIYLRRALGYARDDATVADTIFEGLRFPLATTIIPWQGDFMRSDMVGFSLFDLDKANQILDDAGYEWVEGEQFRRHKDTGEPFEIVWLVAHSDTNMLLVPHHQQNWAEIGLNVVLYRNMLVEFNDRISILTNDTDNGAVHMYDAAWLFGSNPNPRGLWGITEHNDTRYQSPRLNAIMDAIDSPRAWDNEWLIQQYYEWQLAVYEEAPWIPVTTAVELVAVNNRVLNYTLTRKDGIREVSLGAFHLWDLSRDTPYVAD